MIQGSAQQYSGTGSGTQEPILRNRFRNRSRFRFSGTDSQKSIPESILRNRFRNRFSKTDSGTDSQGSILRNRFRNRWWWNRFQNRFRGIGFLRPLLRTLHADEQAPSARLGTWLFIPWQPEPARAIPPTCTRRYFGRNPPRREIRNFGLSLNVEPLVPL